MEWWVVGGCAIWSMQTLLVRGCCAVRGRLKSVCLPTHPRCCMGSCLPSRVVCEGTGISGPFGLTAGFDDDGDGDEDDGCVNLASPPSSPFCFASLCCHRASTDMRFSGAS